MQRLSKQVRSNSHPEEDDLDLLVAVTVGLELVNHSRNLIIQCTKEKRDLRLLEKNPSSFVCITAWKKQTGCYNNVKELENWNHMVIGHIFYKTGAKQNHLQEKFYFCLNPDSSRFKNAYQGGRLKGLRK